VIVIMTFLLWDAWRASDPATRARAWRAILCSTLTAGAAYAIFLLTADFSPRRGTVSPMYVLTLGEAHLVRFPFRFAEGIWMSIAGGIVNAMGGVTLASRLGVVAAAYGALVAGLLFYACRNSPHVATSPATDAIGTRPVLPLGAAFAAGILPTVAMGRIPWDAADGMSSRFELPLLPVTVALIVLISLSLVRPRFWVVPILLFGFVAGNATFTEVWSAVRERQEMSELGAALQPYVAAKDGYTVAAVVLPERSLGPRRDYELTARLAATWPPELRRRFWAFRFGGLRPFVRADYEAEAIFGSRGDCTAPRRFNEDIRHVTRKGPLDQLLWVSRTSHREISIEPYCLEGR
jgi:hypothetical protein